MGLQSIHQVLADKLFLHGHTLVVDNVGEQLEGFPAEVEVVGGEQGGEDRREVGVPEKAEAHSHAVRACGEVAEDADDGRQKFYKRSAVALLEDLIGGNVKALVEEACAGKVVVERLRGGEGVGEPEQVDGRLHREKAEAS